MVVEVVMWIVIRFFDSESNSEKCVGQFNVSTHFFYNEHLLEFFSFSIRQNQVAASVNIADQWRKIKRSGDCFG